MKKLIIATLLITSIYSFAQEMQPEKKGSREQREKMSPEQRNKVLLNRMTKELNLDVKQQEQIKPILAEQSAKNQAMREQRMMGNAKALTKAERKALMKKRNEEKLATDAKLKAILTPEQFTKMKENEEASREKMKEARESRQSRQDQE